MPIPDAPADPMQQMAAFFAQLEPLEHPARVEAMLRHLVELHYAGRLRGPTARRTGVAAQMRALAGQPIGAAIEVVRQSGGSIAAAAGRAGIRVKIEQASGDRLRLVRLPDERPADGRGQPSLPPEPPASREDDL